MPGSSHVKFHNLVSEPLAWRPHTSTTEPQAASSLVSSRGSRAVAGPGQRPRLGRPAASEGLIVTSTITSDYYYCQEWYSGR